MARILKFIWWGIVTPTAWLACLAVVIGFLMAINKISAIAGYTTQDIFKVIFFSSITCVVAMVVHIALAEKAESQ